MKQRGLAFISTSPRNWRSKYPNSSSTSLVAEETWIFNAEKQAAKTITPEWAFFYSMAHDNRGTICAAFAFSAKWKLARSGILHCPVSTRYADVRCNFCLRGFRLRSLSLAGAFGCQGSQLFTSRGSESVLNQYIRWFTHGVSNHGFITLRVPVNAVLECIACRRRS